MARAAGCPFVPPRLVALQEEAPLARVKLWDGSTLWVVTRYAEQRTLLRDLRISADPRRPGYPIGAPPRPNADKGTTIVLN
jgi:hypothetical protein